MGGKPGPFELHRAYIAQRRVKSSVVVEGQPVDDLVHRSPARLEIAPVQSADLQQLGVHLAENDGQRRCTQRFHQRRVLRIEAADLVDDRAVLALGVACNRGDVGR